MSDGGWKIIEPDPTRSRLPTVSFTEKFIRFSSAFVRMADVADHDFAILKLSPDDDQLNVRFLVTDETGRAYTLCKTSYTTGKTVGRMIAIKNLLQSSPRVAALVKLDSSERTFTPRQVGGDEWVIDMAPCFENVAVKRDDLPVGSGIYRYMREAACIYIGKGNLRQRAGEPERANWDYDRIEFSVINDAEAEARWERHWQDLHVLKWGRLPRHNRYFAAAVVS